MPLDLEKREEKANFCLTLPMSAGSPKVPRKARNKPAAIAATEPANPRPVSSTPPKKKPTPLRAFLEPVSSATHWNNCCSPLSSFPGVAGTTVLMAPLALILLRSLAMPLSAWAAIT